LKLVVAFSAALALHAAAAVGVVVLGGGHGAPAARSLVGPTIDVEDVDTPAPTVHDDTVRAVPAAKASRGAPHPVRVLARVAPLETSADVVPQPPPTQEPVAPSRFAMSVSSRDGTPSAPAVAPTAATAIASESNVSVRARKIAGAAPAYPTEAADDGVELDAPLPFEIVVDASGRVTSVSALGHAGHGFDEAAMAALRTYRFSPAERDGRAVAVRMRWTVDFRLQ